MIYFIIQNFTVGCVIAILGVIISRLMGKTAKKITNKFFSQILKESISDFKRGLIVTGIVYFFATILIVFTDLDYKFLFRNLQSCATIIICSFLITIGSIGKESLIQYYENNNKVVDDKDRSITLTLIPIVGSILRYINVVCSFLSLVYIWGIDVTPVLSGTALLLAILGFAGQAILQDVLGFTTLLIDRPFYVGSDVEFMFDNFSERGFIKEITLRNTTVFNSRDGYLFYIPNRDVKNFRVHKR